MVVGGLLTMAATQGLVLATLCIGAVGMAVLLVSFGIERTAAGLIWLAVFCSPLNAVRPTSAASFVTAADLLFVVGFGLLVPVLIPRKLHIPPVWGLGVLIMVAMGFFASLASDEPGLSLNHMTRFLVAAVFLPLAFMYWRPSRRTVTGLVSAYVFGVCVSVLSALVTGPDSVTGRYDGLTTHFNFFGLTGLLAFSATPYIATTLPKRVRPLAWLAGLIAFYGVWISGSRAALLAAVLLAVGYPIVERSLKATFLLLVGGVAGLALSGRILDASGSNALGRLLGGGFAEYADKAREDALQLALTMFHEHPIRGNGFAMALEAHNIYLEIAVCVGVVGTVGYLLIFFTMVKPLFTGLRPDHMLAYPPLAYAMVGMITNALWDRFIWGLLSVCLLAALFPAPDEDEIEVAPGTESGADRWQEGQLREVGDPA